MKVVAAITLGLILGGCSSFSTGSLDKIGSHKESQTDSARLPAQISGISSYTCSQILNANTDNAVKSISSANITITKTQDAKVNIQISALDSNGQTIKLYPYNGFSGDPNMESADPDKCYNVGPIQSNGNQVTIASPCLSTINEGRGSYRSINQVTIDTQTNTVSFINSLRWCANDFFGKCSAIHGPFVNQIAITMKCQRQ